MSVAANAGKAIGMRGFVGAGEIKYFEKDSEIYDHMIGERIRSISFSDTILPGREISLKLFNSLYSSASMGKLKKDGDFFYLPRVVKYEGGRFQITASFMEMSNYTQRYISIDMIK